MSTLRCYSVMRYYTQEIRSICINAFRAMEFDWGPLNLSKQMFDTHALEITDRIYRSLIYLSEKFLQKLNLAARLKMIHSHEVL